MMTASAPMVLNTDSRPRVITAMENNGSPIIGRMIDRSMASPKAAARAIATTNVENQSR